MRSVLAILVVLAALVGGFLTGAATAVAGQEPTAVIDPAVLEALETAGEVEVIIQLVAPAVPPPDQLTPETLEAYRQQVAAVQDRVLAKLSAADFTLTRQYSVVPALAGRITASGVEQLRGHPDVKTVSLNAPLLSPLPVKPGPVSRGDANCDGEVTSIDALLVLQFHAALIDSLPCQDVADVNGDGEIDSRDAMLILQVYSCLPDPVGFMPIVCFS